MQEEGQEESLGLPGPSFLQALPPHDPLTPTDHESSCSLLRAGQLHTLAVRFHKLTSLCGASSVSF